MKKGREFRVVDAAIRNERETTKRQNNSRNVQTSEIG